MSRPRSERLALVGLLVFTIALTILRFYLAATLGAAPDELYYFRWSEHLALNYGDHPPFVAWMMRLGILLVGESVLGLRFAAVLMSAAATAAMYAVGRTSGLSESGAALGAGISSLLIAPASAALICTPDTFLGMFWILAVWAALALHKSGGVKWLYLFAAAFAGGIWSKHAALLMPVLLLPRLRSGGVNRLRRDTPHILFAVLLFVALVLPYLIGEARAGFPSVSFQAAHLAGKLPGSEDRGPFIVAIRLLEVLSGQLGLLSPLVAIFAVGYALRVRDRVSPVLSLALFLPMAAAAIAGLFTHPEQNWAALGHPFAGPMVVLFWTRRREMNPNPRARTWLVATAASVVLIFAAVHLHAKYSMLPLPPGKDPAARLHGFDALSVLEEPLRNVDAAVCDNYGLAAALYWQLRDRGAREKPVVSPDRSHWPAPGNWLLLIQENDFGNTALPGVCEETRSLPDISLRRSDGAIWDTVHVAVGRACAPPKQSTTVQVVSRR